MRPARGRAAHLQAGQSRIEPDVLRGPRSSIAENRRRPGTGLGRDVEQLRGGGQELRFVGVSRLQAGAGARRFQRGLPERPGELADHLRPQACLLRPAGRDHREPRDAEARPAVVARGRRERPRRPGSFADPDREPRAPRERRGGRHRGGQCHRRPHRGAGRRPLGPRAGSVPFRCGGGHRRISPSIGTPGGRTAARREGSERSGGDPRFAP
jgi:hypothetical protein